MQKFKHSAGFTLLEVVVTTAIIAILATIAIPSYRDYVKKSRRSDAKAALIAIQQAQEKYRANCTQYATARAATYSCTGGTFTLIANNTSPDGHYINMTFSTVSSDGYTARITATGAQLTADTDCTSFAVTKTASTITKSSKNSSNAASSGCWD